MAYCSGYPHLGADEGLGLLFCGDNGVGKTHLAVGVLRELVETKGARGQFWDFHELIREIKSSYDPETKTTELQVLEPVVEADVLLLDDLGAWKMTDWMNDTLFYILNSRYMAKRPDPHHHELPGRHARGGARRRPAAAAGVPRGAHRPAPALAAHGDVPGRAPAGRRPPPGAPAGQPGRPPPAVGLSPRGAQSGNATSRETHDDSGTRGPQSVSTSTASADTVYFGGGTPSLLSARGSGARSVVSWPLRAAVG